MSHPLVNRLHDLEPYSPPWWEARDQLAAEAPDAYRRWLDDLWRVDQELRRIDDASQ